MGKNRRTRIGQPIAMIRSSKRREHANRGYAQWYVVEVELVSLVKRARMTTAIDLYRERIPVLRDGLKVATESWLQALWKWIKRQYNTTILGVITAQRHRMARKQYSVIYQLVSTHTAAGYVGMDKFRSVPNDTRNILPKYETASSSQTQSMHL